MRSSIALIILFLGFSFNAQANVQEVIWAPEKVFLPDGFDDNDHTEIVLHGTFPNTCYRAGAAELKKTGSKIVIKNMAYVETDTTCIKMVIPWTTTVTAGMLRAGNYNVFVQRAENDVIPFGSMPVAVALTKTIDEHLYAYVNTVSVAEDDQRITTLTLNGSFSMDCLYIKDVEIVKNKADVINVLPLVEFDQSKPCAHMFIPIPYQKTITLKQPLTETTLFHIRSLNGQSLNYIAH